MRSQIHRYCACRRHEICKCSGRYHQRRTRSYETHQASEQSCFVLGLCLGIRRSRCAESAVDSDTEHLDAVRRVGQHSPTGHRNPLLQLVQDESDIRGIPRHACAQ